VECSVVNILHITLQVCTITLGGSVYGQFPNMATSFRTPSPRSSSYYRSHYQTSRPSPSPTKLFYKHYADWDSYFGKHQPTMKRFFFVSLLISQPFACTGLKTLFPVFPWCLLTGLQSLV